MNVKFKVQWIELLFIAILVVVMSSCVWWYLYRYNGEQFYAKVGKPNDTFKLEATGNELVDGYRYRVRAVNRKGNYQDITFKVVPSDPGITESNEVTKSSGFSNGEIIKLTLNPHFGVTSYSETNLRKLPG